MVSLALYFGGIQYTLTACVLLFQAVGEGSIFGLTYNKAERLARGHKSQLWWFLATTEKKGVHLCRNREERKAFH